jgi:hypothetical protein
MTCFCSFLHFTEHVCICGNSSVKRFFEVPTALIMKSSIFWDMIPYSLLKVKVILKEHIPSIIFLGLLFNPEDGGEIYCSKMPVDFQQSIQHYIPEDRTFIL